MASDNRSVDYLRISITDRCNFKCQYCFPSRKFSWIRHDEIARYEEILKITEIASETGITKVRITGGEPFVRKGIFSFLQKLNRVKNLKDISITTNGSLLNRGKIKKLLNLGIKRLNFSLDTLDPAKFAQITGKDKFRNVWDSILSAHDMGIYPVKVNSVALKGVNDDEIENIASLTLKYPFHIRFIEYMPMGDSSAVEKNHPIMAEEIKKRIESKLGRLLPVKRNSGEGPAKKFMIENAKGIVGFITPISSHFCSQCNRLRLTSRGTLRPCLLNNYEKDILTPLRKGASDNELKEIITHALTKKPLFHNINKLSSGNKKISHMASIGG